MTTRWQKINAYWTRAYGNGAAAYINRAVHNGTYMWACWDANENRQHGIADTLAGAKQAANLAATA